MIDLILQTDRRFNHSIQRYGCFFRSLLAIAETHLKKALSAKDILHIYEMAVAMGPDFMLADCTCKRLGAGGGLVIMGLRLLGSHDFDCRQVGSIDAQTEEISWWGTKCYNYTILLGRTANDKHYRLGDSSGTLLFDPNPKAKIRREIQELLYLVERSEYGNRSKDV